MPVYLDVESRLDARAAEMVARDLTRMFARVGNDISQGLGASLSKAFGALDGSATRREFLMLEQQSRRAADVAEESARREVRALGQVEVARRRANEVTAKYGVESSRAAAANVALVDSHARAAKAQRDHTAAVADAAAAHNAFTNAAEGSTAAVGRFGQAATIASAGVVGGFVAAAVDATKAAGDFQVQLVRLQTVGGELPGNLNAIRDGLMDLASKTGWEPTQLATGMLKVEQAGYRNAEALTVMRSAAQAAAEEGIGLDEAANAVTSTLGDYHLKADQAANVTSKLIEAVRLSKTTFSDFTGSLHNVLPTAAAVGDSLNDLLATMGMLTKSGMHADQASDNLNHALSSLGNIQPKQREMLAAIGLDPRLIPNDIKSKGYIGTAQEIRSAVDRRLGPNGNVILDAFENNPASQALEHEEYGRLSPAEKGVADRIMGGQLSYKDFRKSRGGLGFTEAKIVDQWVQTHENNQGFNRVLKSLNTDQLGVMQALQTAVGGQDNARTMLQVTDQNNSMAVKHRQEIADARADPNGDVMEYKRSQQNFNAQWKDLKASVDALKIEFGEDFLPMATKWVHSLETGVHWMQQHRELVKDLIEDATILSGLFLGMKLSTSLVNTVKEFRKAFGQTKKVVDDTNTSLREAVPAAQAGAAGINRAAAEERGAQNRVKMVTAEANQELRAAGNAAQAGASGVTDAATEDVGAQQRVNAAAAEANAQLRGAGAAAEAGAMGVVAAANTEIGAMNRVMSAANRAKGALAAVGGMALSMGGDALQADTRDNTNPHKLGVIASDAGNMALAGAAVGSVIPGVGTALGGGIGALLGGGYAVWDQYFSGDHDIAAPANPTPDTGPVPVVPDTSAPTPDLTAPVPDTSAPETPDMPYSGGGGGGGKKHKDTDPLDQDLQRIERLQTEANEIQARIADDQKSNDPARRGEIPWLQKKLDEINRELAGISGKGKSGGGSPFMPVKLDDNWLQGGLPSLVRNTVAFLEDLVLGPLEVAAFGGVPNFAGAGGKSGRHSRLGRLERPGGLPGGIPGPLPGSGSAGSAVVPVFVTNWASGGPGGIGTAAGGTALGGGGGTASSSFTGPSAGAADIGGPKPGAGAKGADIPAWMRKLYGLPAAGAAAGGGGPYNGQDAALAAALKAKGFTDSEITGLIALNRVETGNWSHPESIMGFTNQQTGPGIAAHVGGFKDMWDRRQRTGAVPGAGKPGTGIDAQGNVTDPHAYARWLLKLEGYSSTTDAAGNHYPPGMFMSDDAYANSVARAYKPAPHGSGSPASPAAAPTIPSMGMPITQQLEAMSVQQRHEFLKNAFTAPSPPQRVSYPIPGVPVGPPRYYATGGFPGGPKGTDTIPAWLSPGEMVMNANATSQYLPQLKSMNAQYFAPGSGGALDPNEPTPPAQPGSVSPAAAVPKPGAPGGPPPPKPGELNGPKPSGVGATSINDKGVSALTTPGADAQQPGTGQPAQPGIGFSGGFIGAAESAAASAGSMFPGGSAAGAAMQVGFQELNRAAAYGAQDVGIFTEGILESLIPDAGGSSADWSKTIPGRLLMGVTGVRPSASQNTAGQTQQPFASNASGDKFANPDGNVQGQAPIQILGPVHIQADNTKQMHSELNQQTDMAANRFGASQR